MQLCTADYGAEVTRITGKRYVIKEELYNNVDIDYDRKCYRAEISFHKNTLLLIRMYSRHVTCSLRKKSLIDYATSLIYHYDCCHIYFIASDMYQFDCVSIVFVACDIRKYQH